MLRVCIVTVHGLFGGISSVLSGGKFGHGFVSAGFTAAATTFSYSKFPKALGKAGTRVVVNATIGGTASKLSSGKFANGAAYAALASAVKSTVANAAKPDFSSMSDQEVADWLRNNADKLGIELPSDIKVIASPEFRGIGQFGQFVCEKVQCAGLDPVYGEFDGADTITLYKHAFTPGSHSFIISDTNDPAIPGFKVLTADLSRIEIATQSFGHEAAHARGIDVSTGNTFHPNAEVAGLKALDQFRNLYGR